MYRRKFLFEDYGFNRLTRSRTRRKRILSYRPKMSNEHKRAIRMKARRHQVNRRTKRYQQSRQKKKPPVVIPVGSVVSGTFAGLDVSGIWGDGNDTSAVNMSTDVFPEIPGSSHPDFGGVAAPTKSSFFTNVGNFFKKEGRKRDRTNYVFNNQQMNNSVEHELFNANVGPNKKAADPLQFLLRPDGSVPLN